jgi:hypothetical protein
MIHDLPIEPITDNTHISEHYIFALDETRENDDVYLNVVDSYDGNSRRSTLVLRFPEREEGKVYLEHSTNVSIVIDGVLAFDFSMIPVTSERDLSKIRDIFARCLFKFTQQNPPPKTFAPPKFKSVTTQVTKLDFDLVCYDTAGQTSMDINLKKGNRTTNFPFVLQIIVGETYALDTQTMFNGLLNTSVEYLLYFILHKMAC